MATPSTDVINLAFADLIIYALIFPPFCFITYKHGKAGMVCWGIVISFFVMRFVADVYEIIHRNEPEQPNQVSIMTTSGSIACLSLGLIGIIYEANIILPGTPKRWTEKIILGVTHLANTAGLGAATYGSSPSPTGGVVSANLDQIGNCMMLFVMFGVCGWMWPTLKRVMNFRQHPNFAPARIMVLAGAIAMPFQLIRLAYNTLDAFSPYPDLDPFTGSFGVRFLIFGSQLGVVIVLTAGGWLSRNIVPASLWHQQLEENEMVNFHGDQKKDGAAMARVKSVDQAEV